MNAATAVGIGTLATAIAGLSLVGWQLHEQRRAMRAEFGNLYIGRYWQIDDALLFEAKGSARHNQHRHRYLRLFEDEFDVASLGFLERRQWCAWHSVLDDAPALSRVKSDLAESAPDDTSFQRLRACIAQRDREARPHDVADCDGHPSPRERVRSSGWAAVIRQRSRGKS
ncbi:hypothetical protein [Nocardioides dongkuii]|uniref:hypothetical protein n=1 Tax=Nocardioides dongkuii TaxID=2760089 RepID=UPI001878683E|nr:hypothetical protein [Nocardioides dongkuii]